MILRGNRVLGVAVVALLTGNGCAVFGGQKGDEQTQLQKPPVVTENFTVDTIPSGASVRFSTGESCNSPCTIPRDSSSEFSVTIQKEAYKTQTFKVTNNLQALIRYNRAQGKSDEELARLSVQKYSLTPNPLRVTLEPEWSK